MADKDSKGSQRIKECPMEVVEEGNCLNWQEINPQEKSIPVCQRGGDHEEGFGEKGHGQTVLNEWSIEKVSILEIGKEKEHQVGPMALSS